MNAAHTLAIAARLTRRPSMVDFNKLKALGNEYLAKATELAEQAKEKAGPLAEQAKEKAGPLAGKAKDAAVKGTHKAAETLDSRTGGKYSDKIGTVTGKVDTALGKDTVAGPASDPVYIAGDATPENAGPINTAPIDTGFADPGPVDTGFADVGSGTGSSDAPVWTEPATATETDVTGAPADPGWGEDPNGSTGPRSYN